MSSAESLPRLLGARVLFGGALVAAWVLSHRPAPDPGDRVAGRLAFLEASAELGLSFAHEPPELDPLLAPILPQVAGTGAAVSVVDFDGDGLLDVYATTMAAGSPNALFRNSGERFVDVAAEAGLADLNHAGSGASHGSIWADVDRDGDQDVLVYKWGRSQLLLQDAGVFTDHSREAGLDHWMNCTTAAWFDYDRDGLLDLFMGGYYREDTNLWDLGGDTRIMHEDSEFAFNGGRNYLFRNVGAARFEEVGEELGISGSRWTYGVSAADFDGDGWQDLYVANDYGAEELFLNVEGRRFELLTDAGLDTKSKSGMCVSLGDVTNTGRLTVFVTNISEQGWLFQGNNLRICRLPERTWFLNLAEGGHAAQDCGWAWGADFGDLDNDGDQDLVVANGFHSADPERSYWYQMDKLGGATGRLLEDAANWPAFGGMSLSGYQRTNVLLNTSSKTANMVDVAERVGVQDRLDGRAVVAADLFNAGRLDLLIANQSGPLLVYRNTHPVEPGDWIGFALRGTRSNPDGVGAEVTAWFGESVQRQVVTAGSGFSSQTDPRVHYGLRGSTLGRVQVRWPSGTVQELSVDQLAPGRYHSVEEPTR